MGNEDIGIIFSPPTPNYSTFTTSWGANYSNGTSSFTVAPDGRFQIQQFALSLVYSGRGGGASGDELVTLTLKRSGSTLVTYFWRISDVETLLQKNLVQDITTASGMILEKNQPLTVDLYLDNCGAPEYLTLSGSISISGAYIP